MEDEEVRLLTELRESAHDEKHLRAYIFWLEERRDIRADYLKLELELSTLAESDKRFRACKAELRALRRQIDSDWRLAVTQALIENCGAIDAPEGVFEFQCPLRWNLLRQTGDARVRYCDHCHQHVHLCESLTEAQQFANCGACVAIDLAAKAERKKGSIDREDYEDRPRRRMVLGRAAPSEFSRWRRLRAYPSERLRARRKKK